MHTSEPAIPTRRAARRRSPLTCRVIAALCALLAYPAILTAVPGRASATAHLPVVLPPSASWLVAMNFYRAMAGLPSVTEDPVLTAGDVKHARYLALNGVVSHTEDPANQFYTASGAAAGGTSNVAGGPPQSERGWVEGWMAAPFHALGMLRPALTTSGFGSYNGPSFAAGALNVISGSSFGPPGSPVKWPGPGTTVPLTRFSGQEVPDPLTSCTGFTGSVGLPIYLELPAQPNVTAFSVSTGSQSLPTCEFDEGNYNNPDGPSQTTGRSILAEMHAVVLMPRNPLLPGMTYSVSVTNGTNPITWSFTVGIPNAPPPIAAGGSCPIPPQATVIGAAVSVFRSGVWYTRNTVSGGGADACFRLGNPTDIPVWGDWDGDGIITPGVFRRSNATWYLSDSVDGSTVDHVVQFGSSADIPIVGRWINNGPTLLGVFRPANGTWYLRASLTSGPADNAWSFASPGDIPVIGDWNGDATDTIGVFRPSTGQWYLINSFNKAIPDLRFGYGSPGDRPIVGDWNNTGRTSIGVVRGGQWYLANNVNTNGGADRVFPFGDAPDVPVVR